MLTRMQQRRGTAAQWASSNPVLADGEIGYEKDTNKIKMGDGTSTWSALDYLVPESEEPPPSGGDTAITSALFIATSGGDPGDIPSDGTTHTFSWRAYGTAQSIVEDGPGSLEGCIVDPTDDTLIMVPGGRLLSIVRHGVIVTSTDTPSALEPVFVLPLAGTNQTGLVSQHTFPWVSMAHYSAGLYNAPIIQTLNFTLADAYPEGVGITLEAGAPGVTGCYAGVQITVFDLGPVA